MCNAGYSWWWIWLYSTYHNGLLSHDRGSDANNNVILAYRLRVIGNCTSQRHNTQAAFDFQLMPPTQITTHTRQQFNIKIKVQHHLLVELLSAATISRGKSRDWERVESYLLMVQQVLWEAQRHDARKCQVVAAQVALLWQSLWHEEQGLNGASSKSVELWWFPAVEDLLVYL